MMITGFDHFIILVRNLSAAMGTYRRLGFDVGAGGEHPAFGSHNALITLSDATYLELVAFKDPALAARTFWREAAQKLQVREGFDGYALLSNDLANDVQQIRVRGLSVTDPLLGSRVRPDGQRVAWHTAIVGGTPAGALPFLIQDDTPRELRVAPAHKGLGSRARVKDIVVAVKPPDIARDRYRALLDVESRRVQNAAGDVQGFRLTIAWDNIVLAHPERGSNAVADQLAQRGEGLYALTLAVGNLNRERSEMKTRSVKIEEDASGFLILPEAACGARIRLAQG